MSADQETIKDVFSSFFTEQTGPESVRNSMPLGFDAKAWERLSETGAPGMGVSLPSGGGASLSDLVIVAEEAGAKIAPLPIIDHVVATRILEKLDSLEPEVLTGTLLAGLAIRPVENGVAKSVPTGSIANRLIALDEDKLLQLMMNHLINPYQIMATFLSLTVKLTVRLLFQRELKRLKFSREV